MVVDARWAFPRSAIVSFSRRARSSSNRSSRLALSAHHGELPADPVFQISFAKASFGSSRAQAQKRRLSSAPPAIT